MFELHYFLLHCFMLIFDLMVKFPSIPVSYPISDEIIYFFKNWEMHFWYRGNALILIRLERILTLSGLILVFFFFSLTNRKNGVYFKDYKKIHSMSFLATFLYQCCLKFKKVHTDFIAHSLHSTFVLFWIAKNRKITEVYIVKEKS